MEKKRGNLFSVNQLLSELISYSDEFVILANLLKAYVTYYLFRYIFFVLREDI